MRNGDEASPSIILAGLALLVKMFISLELCGSFGSNFFTYVFLHCPATRMQNSDEASLHHLVGQALLMKMRIPRTVWYI